MPNNQNVTYVVDFTIVITRDTWDNLELTFNQCEYSFYDADLISENDGVVTVSIKLESNAFWSTPERAAKYFDEYSETMPEPSIQFGDNVQFVTDTKLYKIIEYGI